MRKLTTLAKLDPSAAAEHGRHKYAANLRELKKLAAEGFEYYFNLRTLNDEFYTAYINAFKSAKLGACICGQIVAGRNMRTHSLSLEHINAMMLKYTLRKCFKVKRYIYIAQRKWRKLAILYSIYKTQKKRMLYLCNIPRIY
jgi:hypothetical protein